MTEFRKKATKLHKTLKAIDLLFHKVVGGIPSGSAALPFGLGQNHEFIEPSLTIGMAVPMARLSDFSPNFMAA